MIYYVEDDANIRELVIYTLQSTGFAARGFTSGAALFEALARQRPELILLDLMLPDRDGIAILEQLRGNSATSDLPVIILSAKGAEYDKVIGLDRGADDYLAKPFGMMELVSRVRAVLRRRAPDAAPQAEEVLAAGEIRLYPDRHVARAGQRELSLTLKEFTLLQYLLENQGIVLSRDRLLERVWGYDYGGETRTVDVHIRSLRQKLGETADLIETVRGVGYRIGGADTE